MILQLSQLVSKSSGELHLLVCVPTKSEQCCASFLSLSIPISLLATPKYRYLPWATSFVRRPLFLHFFVFVWATTQSQKVPRNSSAPSLAHNPVFWASSFSGPRVSVAHVARTSQQTTSQVSGEQSSMERAWPLWNTALS